MEELLYQVIGKLYIQNLILQDQVGLLRAEIEELSVKDPEGKKPAKSEEGEGEDEGGSK